MPSLSLGEREPAKLAQGEGENLSYFGSAYQEYMGETKMFVPFVFYLGDIYS